MGFPLREKIKELNAQTGGMFACDAEGDFSLNAVISLGHGLGFVISPLRIFENKESKVSNVRGEGRGNVGNIFATEAGCSSPSITLVVIT